VSQQREGLPDRNLVIAKGAALKPQCEEELEGCSFSAGHFCWAKRHQKRGEAQ